jgi:hypothetical protein
MSMANRIRVAVLDPGKPLSIEMVENSLSAVQTLVGGFIDHMPFGFDSMAAIFNEDGRDLTPNIWLAGHSIRGTTIIVSEENGEFVGLRNEQIETLERTFGRNER